MHYINYSKGKIQHLVLQHYLVRRLKKVQFYKVTVLIRLISLKFSSNYFRKTRMRVHVSD